MGYYRVIGVMLTLVHQQTGNTYGNMSALRKVFALNNLKAGDRFSGEPQIRDKLYSRRPHLRFDRIARLRRITSVRIFPVVTYLELSVYKLASLYKKRKGIATGRFYFANYQPDVLSTLGNYRLKSPVCKRRILDRLCFFFFFFFIETRTSGLIVM